jgi:perosamine synthetase
MFQLEREFGQHKVYRFDSDKYNFRNYLETLFQSSSLEQLHLTSEEYKAFERGELEALENKETELHKLFYKDIKTNPTFKRMYVALVKDLYKEFFPKESALIYQSFPSIRFQFPNNIAVPAHCDSDELGKHPLGEKNFLLPITTMKGTNRLFIESEPKKGDYTGIDLSFGELFYFNGNTCIHMNQSNKEEYVRISFDFRILTPSDYKEYVLNNSVTMTNPRDVDKNRKPVKMLIGGYYQIMFANTSLEENLEWHSQSQPIMQTRPVFDEKESEACIEYLQTGEPFLTEFRKTTELETCLKEFIGVNHCFMTTSGTTAIMTALLALDLEVGSEVIVPNYTMIATANAVRALGYKPILVDVNPTTYTLDLSTLQRFVTDSTKAVIHVSLNNRSTGLKEIAEFCKKANLYLIEDAAQSLGCFLDGKAYGTFGDIGCFSLSTPKIISTGQGGFVVTNNADFATRMFKIKNFGRKSGGIEEYDVFGLNFKITDLQAVVGLAQMKKLPARIERMKEIFTLYKKHLAQTSSIQLLDGCGNESWIPWFVDILVEDRPNLMKFLKQHQIDTRICYPSIHTTPMYSAQGTDSSFLHSSTISDKGLFLPTHFKLTDNEIRYIVHIIKTFYC